MKYLGPELVDLLRSGYGAPMMTRLAKKVKQPRTTIHYNIKKLEKQGVIRAYKAVFDYKKIDQGFCCFVQIQVSQECCDSEKIGKELAKLTSVESVDICMGEYELILRVRVKDQDEYYSLVKNVIQRKGIAKIKTIASMKQLKTEFVVACYSKEHK